MPDTVRVCPICHCDDIRTVDQFDYGVWVVVCDNCGWDGTTDDLVPKEAGF